MKLKDATFVAPATPYGHSGIAIIRLNGPNAQKIIQSLSKNYKIQNRSPRLVSLYNLKNTVIDECIVTHYEKPNSYTGDDLIEISCHGNPSIIDALLDSIVQQGARLAEPGEFTKRAFINGKLDLLQAEAVGGLISAQSEVAAKIHQNTLSGNLSKKINEISEQLITRLSSIEHAIDISEEELTSGFFVENKDALNDLENKLDALISTFSTGRLINDGIRVVIAGKPNVGKSTLLNHLSGYDRAIVSDVPGTTRDAIETTTIIDGIPIKYIDTAGIHPTEDKIEKIGIQKTNKEIDSADLILYINDDPKSNKFPEFNVTTIHVLNKIDLHKKIVKSNSIIHISAKTGKNVDILLKKIKQTMSIEAISTDTPHLTSMRQYTALKQTSEAIERSLGLMKARSPNMELVAFELRAALDALDTLMGKTSPDDILNNIFNNLCVGK